MALVQLQNQYASSVESSTYDQVKEIENELNKLSFDIYQATDMTKSLERNMVQILQTIANNNGKTTENTLIEKQTKNAFNFQMYAYFKNRDLIYQLSEVIKLKSQFSADQ